MKRTMQGLLWLFLLEFALLVMSLEPGFLDFDNLPDTNFSCVGKVIGGYYADLETNCQMFHVCTIGQLEEPMDIRFLCLNGTVFDQETRVCERIDEVDCSKSEQFYSLNLELYGNTQPPILEESPEIDYSLDSKTSTTAASTSTVTQSTFPPFFTTPSTATNRDISKVITSHHFPVNAPDIRFNPEEINISLKAGAPPDISRSQVPISYQQRSFSEKNTRVTVTTHTTIYKNEKQNRVPLLSTTHQPLQSLIERTETTLTPKSIVSYGLTHNQGSQVATPTEINYGFSYPQTEESGEYHTEIPPHPYQYQLNIANFRPPTAEGHPYHSIYRSNNKRPHKINFPATTYRNHPAYTSSTKSPSYQTEKLPHLQLPLPLLPTLPPLTFSSPSPFSVGHHIETKRYTKDHQSPPRIIISASASVSDNNGRRLNYSLGTIGASHILGSSPASYDDYKEEDVISDPFYHDVPKLKKSRRRRNVDDDVIRNDQEAEDLLRHLFNWYKNREEKAKHILIPVSADDISQINDQLAPVSDAETSMSDAGYERIFRKILMETETENRDKTKTEDIDTNFNAFSTTSDISTTPPNPTDNDDETISTTLLTTTEINTFENKKQNRRKSVNSPYFAHNENKKNDENHVHTNLEIHYELTAKNHTRRSGHVSSGKQSNNQDNSYDLEDAKTQDEFIERQQFSDNEKKVQKSIRRQTINVEEFQNSINVERNLETTPESTYGSSNKTLQQDDVTTVNSNLETIATTVNTDYDYNFKPDESFYDAFNVEPNQNSTETTLVEPTTTEVFNAQPQQSIPEYDYENSDNFYEDLNYDTTTISSTQTDVTNDLVDFSTTITTTDRPKKNILPTEKSNYEILQSETQSLSQKEWNEVISFENNLTNKNLKKKTVNDSNLSRVNVKNETTIDIKNEKEYPLFTIPDYVDDNYEPLTYQIDTPVKEYKETTTKKKVETTTTAFTTDLDISNDSFENVTETVKEDKVATNTEFGFSETFITVQNIDFTTIPVTTAPIVTTNSAETTLVTEGIVTEATTEQNTSNTEYYTETNLPTTFTTYITTVAQTATETNFITDATQPVTELTATPSSTTTSQKELNRKEQLRHRFGSFGNRKRGRGESKFKNNSLQVLSTVVSNKNDSSSINNSTIRLEKQKINTNIKANLTEFSLKLESTTIPTNKYLETEELKPEISLTDAPLLKSANPTKSKYTKIVLSTTPLTKVVRVDIRKEINDRRFIFNCFNKKIHHFYSDPRDCRLFHYCTVGYTKNQLVDMKFVCDLGTYYDEEKFICTKIKPARCLKDTR